MVIISPGHGLFRHSPHLYAEPDCDDYFIAVLLQMVLQHCGSFRLVAGKTEHFRESKAIPANADAMHALADEGFIELEVTEENQPNIAATVTTQGWLLFQRFKHEQKRKQFQMLHRLAGIKPARPGFTRGFPACAYCQTSTCQKTGFASELGEAGCNIPFEAARKILGNTLPSFL
jgi:hypothetical protein